MRRARRIVSLWLPRFAAEWRLRGMGGCEGPFAIVGEENGALRLTSLNAAAEAAGLGRHMGLSDARAIREFLIGEESFSEETVTLLLGEQATGEAIRQQLHTALPAVTKKNDRVLVFFAGHGQQTLAPGSQARTPASSSTGSTKAEQPTSTSSTSSASGVTPAPAQPSQTSPKRTISFGAKGLKKKNN